MKPNILYSTIRLLRRRGSGCSLRVRVQPRASRDRVAGFRVTGSGEDVLRLSVTASPAGGQSQRRRLGPPGGGPGNAEIASGHRSGSRGPR